MPPSALFQKLRQLQRFLQDESVRTFAKKNMAKRAESFMPFFESYLAPSSRVLDIGGGWGFYAAPMAQRGHHLTVLDVVKPGYQCAPVVVYDPRESFPFPEQSFDASCLITVLHHMDDPAFVLREARRVTRRFLIVIEDLYHHYLGRLWTIWRDQLFNFEFFGHPSQFKKKDEWVAYIEPFGFKLKEAKEVPTALFGLPILNGVLVFEVRD